MQSIHDQQQNINSSSRSLQTKVKMANCIFGYQVKKQNFPIFHIEVNKGLTGLTRLPLFRGVSVYDLQSLALTSISLRDLPFL